MRQCSVSTKGSLSESIWHGIRVVLTDRHRKLETQQQIRSDAHQRQLETAQKEAAAAMELLRVDHHTKEAELQRQIEYVRKTAEAEAARIQRRAEADMADLRATISRLEVDLMKVCTTV